MELQYFLEEFLPFYKKYLIKKIIKQYKIILYNFINPMVSINNHLFIEYIFYNELNMNYEILIKTLSDFNYEFISNENMIFTKKVRYDFTLKTIHNNPKILYDFCVKLYKILQEKYDLDTESTLSE